VGGHIERRPLLGPVLFTVSASAGQRVKLNDTAPTTDRWDLAAVEITPASTVAVSAPVLVMRA